MFDDRRTTFGDELAPNEHARRPDADKPDDGDVLRLSAGQRRRIAAQGRASQAAMAAAVRALRSSRPRERNRAATS